MVGRPKKPLRSSLPKTPSSSSSLSLALSGPSPESCSPRSGADPPLSLAINGAMQADKPATWAQRIGCTRSTTSMRSLSISVSPNATPVSTSLVAEPPVRTFASVAALHPKAEACHTHKHSHDGSVEQSTEGGRVGDAAHGGIERHGVTTQDRHPLGAALLQGVSVREALLEQQVAVLQQQLSAAQGALSGCRARLQWVQCSGSMQVNCVLQEAAQREAQVGYSANKGNGQTLCEQTHSCHW